MSNKIVEFLAFLSGLCPAMRNCIQELRFETNDFLVELEEPVINSQILSFILSSLPRLHSLPFINMLFNGHTLGLPSPHPIHQLRLLEFWFVCSDLYTTEDVLDILGLFSNVDVLRCDFKRLHQSDALGASSFTRYSLRSQGL